MIFEPPTPYACIQATINLSIPHKHEFEFEEVKLTYQITRQRKVHHHRESIYKHVLTMDRTRTDSTPLHEVVKWVRHDPPRTDALDCLMWGLRQSFFTRAHVVICHNPNAHTCHPPNQDTFS